MLWLLPLMLTPTWIALLADQIWAGSLAGCVGVVVFWLASVAPAAVLSSAPDSI